MTHTDYDSLVTYSKSLDKSAVEIQDASKGSKRMDLETPKALN